jgi:hypothetical protein
MITEISKAGTNLRVFQPFADFLKDIWKLDNTRPWDHYFKEQQFSYFWDTGKEVQK